LDFASANYDEKLTIGANGQNPAVETGGDHGFLKHETRIQEKLRR
jgi:hypothetical protein